jgi:hypothetical protein
MYEWCREQFGYAGERWDFEYQVGTRYGEFKFKKEKDLTWFIMRWSSV